MSSLAISKAVYRPNKKGSTSQKQQQQCNETHTHIEKSQLNISEHSVVELKMMRNVIYDRFIILKRTHRDFTCLY